MIRPAKQSDAIGLGRLAKLLNTTNLPDSETGIAEILAQSESSFMGEIRQQDSAVYLFVLEDLRERQVIGSSQILARHGTPELPHIYFQVDQVPMISRTLEEYREHTFLTLGFNTKGMTELGGLILDPRYRGCPVRLGRALSLCRLDFIRQNPTLFMEDLLAELLPPFDSNGNSPFWEALGSHFMGLSYQQADHLSRKQKEFIETLFPKYPICASLLSKEAQSVIGCVGAGSAPAAHLLSKLGFRYQNRVDPFDGGPHFEMKTQALPEIELPSDLRYEIPSL